MRKRWWLPVLLAGASLILIPASSLAQETAEEAQEPAPAEEPVQAEPEMPQEGAEPAETHSHEVSPLDHPAGPHHPPTQGHWVREHWTPYDPPDPAAFPESSRVHIIVQGDTLWDLATAFLSDPLLWPQLWDQNRYILDSHWIYPGDPLLIPGMPTVVSEEEMLEEMAEEEIAEIEEEIEEEEPAPPPVPVEVKPILTPGQPLDTGPPVAALPELTGPQLRPVANESDLYCSSYLVQNTDLEVPKIAQRAEPAKEMLSPGDIVYIDRGIEEDVLPGANYQLVRFGRVVNHPATKKPVGTVLEQLGRVTILASQEHSATGWIDSACAEILVGDLLVPFEERPVPLSAGAPLELYGQEFAPDRTGFIVYGEKHVSFGEGEVIDIDMGEDHELEPGDYLTIFRDYREPHKFFSIHSDVEPPSEKELLRTSGRYPPLVVGQIVILRVGEKSASAMIVESLREIYVGDKVAKL